MKRWLLWILLAIAVPARAIDFVGTPTQGGGTSQASPLNVSYTVPATGARRIVFCVAHYFDDDGTTITGMSYAGSSMGAARATVGSVSAGGISIYALTAPTTGANNCSFTFSGGTSATMDELYIQAFSLENVNQSSPFGTPASATVMNANSINPGTITVTGNDIGIAAAFGYNGATMTFTQSDTLVIETEGTGAASGRAIQRGDGTLTWTTGGLGGDTAAVAIPVAHDAGSGSSGALLLRRRKN